MHKIELEEKIVGYMNDLYNVKYLGYIKVTEDNGQYTLELGLPSYMNITYISGQFTSDGEFLDYVKEELRKRNYIRLLKYKVTRTDEKKEH